MEDEELDEIVEAARTRSINRPHFPDGVSAPFRFVALPDLVAMPEHPGHPIDVPLQGGVSADITVDWAAESPLLIGQSTPIGQHGEGGSLVEPMALPKADPDETAETFIIPGASLRGMIRAATEIVALGRLGFTNLHHRYGLRDFNHKVYGEVSPVSKADQVMAGWLEVDREPEQPQDPDNPHWFIRPLGKRWAHIEIGMMGPFLPGGHANRQTWIMKSLEDKYRVLKMAEYGGEETAGYLFDFEGHPVTVTAPWDDQFQARDGTPVRRTMTQPGSEREGIMVVSDAVTSPNSNKKLEYVFFDEPSAERIKLDPIVVEDLRRLYSTRSSNKPEPDGTYAKLLPTLRAGRRVPVFYVGDPNNQIASRFFLGFTRLLKVPHRRSIQSVLASAHPNHVPPQPSDTYDPDFVENLFGYVVELEETKKNGRQQPEAVARRGRVAFSMATLSEQTPARKTANIPTVMMAPRASFAPFYLMTHNPGDPLDYSSDRPVGLAGRKRYLPRVSADGRGTAARDCVTGAIAEDYRHLLQEERRENRDHNTKLDSHLHFLVPEDGRTDLMFRSRIRLHNVTPAELGAVLFALTHGGDPDKPYRHMIGRGKPYGAGQLRVHAARLAVRPHDHQGERLVAEPADDERITPDGLRGFCPAEDEGQPNHSHRPFLTAFVETMRRLTERPEYPDIPSLREFFGVCDPATAREIGDNPLMYMPLGTFRELRDAVKWHKKYHSAVSVPANGRATPRSDTNRVLPAPPAEVPAAPTGPKGVSTKE